MIRNADNHSGECQGVPAETKEVIGGFAVLEVASREEALAWAAKIAAGCRCAQEVRELLPDPEQEEMLRRTR